MQTCKKCKAHKQLDMFYPSRENSLGVKKICKSCELSLIKKRKEEALRNKDGNLSLPDIEELNRIASYNEDGSLTIKVSAGNQKAGRKTFGVNNGSGYKVITINGVCYKFHRVVWKMNYGDEPKYIDHINHKRDDNRIENLRFVSREENARHQVKPKNNTTGFIGVHKHYKSWVAIVLKDGERHRVGRFKNIKDAVLAYNEKCNELHGEFGKSKIIHNMEELKRRGII